MSSETQNLSTTKVDAPAYKVIAEQIAALMAAGAQVHMDQDTIRAAIHTFGNVAASQVVYPRVEGCSTNRCLG